MKYTNKQKKLIMSLTVSEHRVVTLYTLDILTGVLDEFAKNAEIDAKKAAILIVKDYVQSLHEVADK